jgi:hypothetical protein
MTALDRILDGRRDPRITLPASRIVASDLIVERCHGKLYDYSFLCIKAFLRIKALLFSN